MLMVTTSSEKKFGIVHMEHGCFENGKPQELGGMNASRATGLGSASTVSLQNLIWI
jgi:hypothetical protein